MQSDDSQPQPSLRPKRLKGKAKWASVGGAATLAGLTALLAGMPQYRHQTAQFFGAPDLGGLQVNPLQQRWGVAIDRYDLIESELKSGDILGNILMAQGMSYPEVHQLVEQARQAGFNITSMRTGKKLFFLREKQTAGRPRLMVYEPSPFEYLVFDLTAPFQVHKYQRAVKTDVVAASGVLETSFWQALTDNGLSDELADGMIDILASSVDFYHQKQGDRFKLIYEQHYVEGKAVGTGKIIAAVYERDGKEYYAFNFEREGESCKYYDFEGRPARKAFLKAPVKFSRISSRYNLNRLHPVLGYHKAHFGTDYAAPYGTPIMAVADGTVTGRLPVAAETVIMCAFDITEPTKPNICTCRVLPKVSGRSARGAGTNHRLCRFYGLGHRPARMFSFLEKRPPGRSPASQFAYSRTHQGRSAPTVHVSQRRVKKAFGSSDLSHASRTVRQSGRQTLTDPTGALSEVNFGVGQTVDLRQITT